MRRELDRHRRAELGRSLHHPHPESTGLAEQGLEEWMRAFPEEDPETLLDGSGKPIRWVPGVGWVKKRY